MALGDADSVILHFKARLVSLCPPADADVSSGRRVFHCIIDQVFEDLADSFFFGPSDDRRRRGGIARSIRGHGLENLTLRLGPGPVAFQAGTDGVLQLHRLELEAFRTGFDPGKAQ